MREANTPDTGREERGAERDALPPVSQVGRYLLLKPLGHGGMGVVYAAYDPDLNRKVALKLLRPDGQADSEAARARLLREAQALARVSHPHVIPIFDVGVWGDQVFLAMELVDGGTLGAWLKEEPRPWREVLARFLDAGRGLQAAHEAGLVHRDFKPANVLVSRAGRVYVTDFGLARQVGAPLEPEEALPEEARELVPPERRLLETPLTETGLVMGTPHYMSPEQLQGAELDARSDQFSFCVALYWGLYRQRAFKPASMREFVDALSRRTEPTQPLADLIQEPPRDAKVPAWVRQAVMRGLSLRPGDRFPSMEALLEALSQERRLAQRRRWVTAACTVGVGLAVVGGGVYQQSQVCADAGAPIASVWGPEARRTLEAAFTATGRPFAAQMAARVSGVLDERASEWARQSTEACEATRVQATQPEELLARRVVCLERRRQDMRAAVELLSGADAAVVEKALDVAHALPSPRECEDVSALSEQQPLPADEAKRADIARLGAQLAEVKALVDAGRYPVALEKARTLEAPVRATGYPPLLAEQRLHQGWLHEQLGDSAEAARVLTEAVQEAEAGRADRLKVSILNRLLFVEDGLKHVPQAEGWAGLAEATLRRLGGDAALEADVLVNRANLAMSQQHFPEARSLLERARTLQARALAAENPKRARTTYLLGGALLNMGEHAKAVELLEEALKQTEASVGALHPDMARRHGMLSFAYRELNNAEQALAHARKAADIRKALFGPESVTFAEALDEVGMGLLELKRYEEALRVYEEALAAKRKALPPGDERLQYSYDGVGQALLGLGRPRDAVEPLRQAVTFASAPPDVLAESGFALARALWQSGEQPEARGEAARARERFTQAALAPRVAEVDAWLGTLPPTPERRPARPARPRGRR